MSDEKPFDPQKFKEQLRDQIHRSINDGLPSRRNPMVVGIALRGRGRGGIVTGGILVVIGIAFLLDHMGYISIGSLWRYWPMLIILAGALNFISQRRGWGLLLVFAGAILQLNQLGITHFGWESFWPMMLIAVGIFIMWGSLNGAPNQELPRRLGLPAILARP